MRPSTPSLIVRFITFLKCLLGYHDYQIVQRLTSTSHMLHSPCCNTYWAMDTQAHQVLPFDQELDDMYHALDIDTKVIRHNHALTTRLKHSQNKVLKRHSNRGGALSDMLFSMAILALFVVLIIMGLAHDKTTIDAQQAQQAHQAQLKLQNQIPITPKPPLLDIPLYAEAPTTSTPSKRFSLQFEGEFNAGHQNNLRQVFTLTDHITGYKYLAITGCGVSELLTTSREVKTGRRTKETVYETKEE